MTSDVAGLQTVFAVVVWSLIAYYLLRAWRQRAKPAAPPATVADTTSALVPGTTPSLATRLHAIDEAIEPFARNAAHLRELMDHEEFRKAVALLADPDVPLSTTTDYAFGQTWILACAGYMALKERADGHSVASQAASRFDDLALWPMRFALDYLANTEPRIAAGAPLVGHRDWWNENAQLAHAFGDYFHALGPDDPGEITPDVQTLPATRREQIKTFLGNIRHPIAARLAGKLGGYAPGDNQGSPFLNSLGRFWKSEDETALLIKPEIWSEALKVAERIAEKKPPPVLLVTGETMTGKSAFLKLLCAQMSKKGWRVFQASGADLQAGQIYIGQLEARIREAIGELDAGRKIIWYVPDLLALALSGTHQSQSASILDQMIPAISTGKIQIWSEATPTGLTRLQQLRPTLRRMLEIVRLEPMDEDETLLLANGVAKVLAQKAQCEADPSFATAAVDVADHYLSSLSLPGAALSLMKMTAQRVDKSKTKRFTGQDILESLSQMTGLPMSLLDGAERLDLEKVREFFSSRVIGQSEAVTSIVERIAMLKSGLNDPGKPIGVFLFAGPTGTGKTELAKTTAEYLFGSVDRMIRLDMSEFQTHESSTKILGGGPVSLESDTIIARVRKQPFSIILLDEFEKAHPMIWDLFLQVFDDGRLTDAAGQTADFRHSLIILTTNLGATAHRDSGIGFAPTASTFTNEQVLRAIGQTFRPEFQNRLDKIIVFKPLTRELMRGILTKELARLFERRGLKERDWAVEWDSSALEFLLERGFTPEMGARPLKRAIDQYVVAPLAETIVERRFPEGDQFVFVRRDGNALRADFVDPDADEGQADHEVAPLKDTGERPSLFEMLRAPSGSGGEVAALTEALELVVARTDASDWSRAKSELAGEINSADFWSRSDRFATLARLELMDRLAVATETAKSLQARLARTGSAGGKTIRDLVARLAMQIHLVKEGLKDLDEKAPAEVALVVEPIFAVGLEDSERARAWCSEISGMYRAWADNRNMHLTELDSLPGPTPHAVVIGGFGAHRALSREAGLHILELGDGGQSNRVAAHVKVAEMPSGNLSKVAIRQTLAAAFGKTQTGSHIVRRYRRSPSPLVRNGTGTWRSGKVEEVLRGNFDVIGPEPEQLSA